MDGPKNFWTCIKGCDKLKTSTPSRVSEQRLSLIFLRWEFIKENKKVKKKENTLSTKKVNKKKRKKNDYRRNEMENAN